MLPLIEYSVSWSQTKEQKQRLDSEPLYIRVLRHGRFLPVAPHSEGCESLLHIDRYRGIVEEAVFDPLGQRLFFDAAVEVVMGRIAARIGRDSQLQWMR